MTSATNRLTRSASQVGGELPNGLKLNYNYGRESGSPKSVTGGPVELNYKIDTTGDLSELSVVSRKDS